MIKNFHFLFVLLLAVNVIGQDDDIYLFPDFVIYKGDTLCQIDNHGLKQGEWIDYELNYNLMVLIPDSCSENESSDMHGNLYKVQYYSRYKNTKDSDCDSIFSNVIPNIVVDFLSYGAYSNDLKTGKWQTYDKDGNIYKELNYQDGQITNNIIYYHKNGLIKVNGKITDDNKHVDAKIYSDKGKLIKETRYKLEDIALIQ